MPPAPQVRCRQIKTSDLEVVSDVLARGFPDRPRKYWTNALETLRARPAVPGCPEYGFLLEADGQVVGVHLLIFHQYGEGANAQIRCNTSSWCVDRAYRGHAAMLATMASKLKHVTYLNTSAANHTWPILEALGYQRYSEGQFVALPALSLGRKGKVARLNDGPSHRAIPEYELLRVHADAGCLVLVCKIADDLVPFVFLRRNIRYAPIGVMQLMYCRDTANFVASAGSIGWFLLGQRATCVICDSDGPIPGLVGRYFSEKTPRFYKGPNRPRPNDLTFTETVLFGP